MSGVFRIALLFVLLLLLLLYYFCLFLLHLLRQSGSYFKQIHVGVDPNRYSKVPVTSLR